MSFWISYALLWLIVVFQGALLVEIVRRLGTQDALQHSGDLGADPLPAGTLAPAFFAQQLGTDNELLDSSAQHGDRTLLLFLSAACSTCVDAAARGPRAATQNNATLLAICRGTRRDCDGFAREYLQGIPAVWDDDGAIGRDYQVRRTPVAVLVDDEWRILRYGAPVDLDGPGGGREEEKAVAARHEASAPEKTARGADDGQ